MENILTISNLHVRYADNKKVVERLRSGTDGDLLLLAGGVGDDLEDIEWAPRRLSDRFVKVVWVPGNDELWTRPGDPVSLRGEARYRHLLASSAGRESSRPRTRIRPGAVRTVRP